MEQEKELLALIKHLCESDIEQVILYTRALVDRQIIENSENDPE